MSANQSENVVVWVHGDCLSPTNPALQAYPDAPAIFVWDEALLASSGIAFKRVLFMYESLLEMPVIIRRGNVAEELLRFAQEHDASTIVTTETPAPRFHRIARQVNRQIDTLRIYRVLPFIATQTHFDLKRFSRYWRTAKKFAFDPS
ncbi:MAG: hypothetical protein ACPG8W_23520 [Candidatus Promineifilaceae bacterium]